MTTYRNLYHGMVRSMSEAIDLYDAGKGILAREVMQKALLDAEEQVIAYDIIPDEPISSGNSAENENSSKDARQKCGEDNPKRRGEAPPFWSLGVQGRNRNAPAVLLGDSKGAFSHARERPLCPVQRHRRCYPYPLVRG